MKNASQIVKYTAVLTVLGPWAVGMLTLAEWAVAKVQ